MSVSIVTTEHVSLSVVRADLDPRQQLQEYPSGRDDVHRPDLRHPRSQEPLQPQRPLVGGRGDARDIHG